MNYFAIQEKYTETQQIEIKKNMFNQLTLRFFLVRK